MKEKSPICLHCYTSACPFDPHPPHVRIEQRESALIIDCSVALYLVNNDNTPSMLNHPVLWPSSSIKLIFWLGVRHAISPNLAPLFDNLLVDLLCNASIQSIEVAGLEQVDQYLNDANAAITTKPSTVARAKLKSAPGFTESQNIWLTQLTLINGISEEIGRGICTHFPNMGSLVDYIEANSENEDCLANLVVKEHQTSARRFLGARLSRRLVSIYRKGAEKII